jgi:hypothetical protein
MARRFDAAIARSIDLSVDYGTDGSVVLRPLAIDAVRTAVFEPTR